jgi:hypothetical protein
MLSLTTKEGKSLSFLNTQAKALSHFQSRPNGLSRTNKE